MAKAQRSNQAPKKSATKKAAGKVSDKDILKAEEQQRGKETKKAKDQAAEHVRTHSAFALDESDYAPHNMKKKKKIE